jgi:hypothetical protein
MTIANLQYIWDGKRIFIRHFAGSDRPFEQRLPEGTSIQYAVFAELPKQTSAARSRGSLPPELTLIGTFDFRPEVSFTRAFVHPASATRLRLGRFDAAGWSKDELIIDLDPDLLPDTGHVRILPFAIRFEEDNSSVHVEHSDEFMVQAARLMEALAGEEVATGTRQVAAQIYYRRISRQAGGPEAIAVGSFAIKKAQLNTKVRISAKRETRQSTKQLKPDVSHIQRNILRDHVDELDLCISIPGIEHHHNQRELQKLLEQVYLVHIPLQIQTRDKAPLDINRPMKLPESVLDHWGALRLPSERARYSIVCLADAFANHDDNTSGIVATRKVRSTALDEGLNLFFVHFGQAAVCDIVGVFFAGDATFSAADDATLVSSKDISQEKRSGFFRVLDGVPATDQEMAPYLSEVEAEAKRLFRAEADKSSINPGPADHNSLVRVWLRALLPSMGLDPSKIVHPLEAEAFADAITTARQNAAVQEWPPEEQVGLFSQAPALFSIALDNDALARRIETLTAAQRRNLLTPRSLPASLMAACGRSDIPPSSEPNHQIAAWDLAKDFTLFERLCRDGISPFDDVVVVPEVLTRLNSLWSDGNDNPLEDWVSYAESSDASVSPAIVDGLRILFENFRKPFDVRGWFSLKDALALADKLALIRQAFVTQTGPWGPPDSTVKRLDQTALISKIRDLIRFADGKDFVAFDIDHARKRIKQSPIPPILLLEDWYNKLKTVLGSSEIDRNLDELIHRLGERAAGLSDTVATFSKLEIPAKERRTNLSDFLKRTSPMQIPQIEDVRQADRLGQHRLKVHSQLKAALTTGLHNDIRGSQDVPELYRLADVLLHHNVFAAVSTVLRSANAATVQEDQISKATRYLALWPQRAEATVQLGISIESATGTGQNLIANSLQSLDGIKL